MKRHCCQLSGTESAGRPLRVQIPRGDLHSILRAQQPRSRTGTPFLLLTRSNSVTRLQRSQAALQCASARRAVQ
eukprot:894492-Rhodomonas_salina.2